MRHQLCTILFSFLYISTGLAAQTRPELVLQMGHFGAIRAVAISPDGKWLVSGSQDSTVKIWNLQNGDLLRTLYGHNGKINSVSISSDGRWIASAADDNTARLWNVTGGGQERSLGGHIETVRSIAFAPGGQQVITASNDMVRVWDTATGTELRSIRINEKDRAGRISISADGRFFVTGGAPQTPGGFGTFLGGGGSDAIRPLKVYDVSSSKEVRSFKTEMDTPFASYVISPDSRFLARRGIQLSQDKRWDEIHVYDLNSGKEIAKLKIPGDGMGQATGAIVFSSDSKWLAAASDIDESMKAYLHVFDVASQQKIRTLSTSTFFVPSMIMDVNKTFSNPLVFSPDNKVIVLGGLSSISLWETATGKELEPLRTNFKAGALSSSATDPMWSKAVEQSGWNEEAILEMSSTGESMLDALYAPDSPMGAMMGMAQRIVPNTAAFPSRILMDNRLQFSPDSRWMITEKRESIRVWDATTGMPYQPALRWRAPIAFSPDGSKMAVNQLVLEDLSESDDLTIFDTTTMAVVKKMRLTGGDRAIELAFNKDGSRLVLVTRGRVVRILDSQNSQLLTQIPVDPDANSFSLSANGRYLATGALKGDTISPFQGMMSGNNKAISKKDLEKISKQMAKLMGGQQQTGQSQEPKYEIQIMDLEQARVMHNLKADLAPTSKSNSHIFPMNMDSGIRKMGFSPSGRFLVIEDLSQSVQSLKIYDTASGKTTAAIPIAKLKSTTDLMESIKKILPVFTFSPDERILAINSQDPGYAVNFWDPATGKMIRTLAHPNRVDAVTFSPDGKRMITLIRDGSELVWDTTSGTLLATMIQFQRGGSIEWLAATPDGFFDGSPAAWQQILWRFSGNTFDIAPVETFFGDFYFPGLLQEIFEGRIPNPPRDISQIDRRQPHVSIHAEMTNNPRMARVTLEIQEQTSDASGSGARDVRLFRNGSLVKRWRGDVLQGQNKVMLETQVPVVSGTNRLVAYAFNHDNVKSADATFMITGAESLARKGIAYVLAIGVNEYENSDFNLKYTVADAQAFADNMVNAQSRLGGFEKVETILLFDRNASKAKIMEALQKLEPTQPEDAVFVYYAGHGTAQQSHFYMIPSDLGYSGSRSQLTDSGIKTILSRSISDEELEQIFEKIGAGQTVFIIDACNSGQALEAEEKRRGPMNAKGLAQLAYEKGMYVLAAAQSYQAALEAAKLGHGYLTYALVEEGMKTAAADDAPQNGEVVAREWLNYAASRVPQMQMEKIQEARLLKHEVPTTAVEVKIQGSAQQPRLFYRRDIEFEPLVIWKQ